MPRGETDADVSAERMPDENHRSVNPIEQILLDQIGVVNGVPVGAAGAAPRRSRADRSDGRDACAGRAWRCRAGCHDCRPIRAETSGDGSSTSPITSSIRLAPSCSKRSTSMSPLRTVEGRSVSRRYCVSECGSSVANGHREAQTLIGRQGPNLDACARAIDRAALDDRERTVTRRRHSGARRPMQDRQVLHPEEFRQSRDRVRWIVDERFVADEQVSATCRGGRARLPRSGTTRRDRRSPSRML